MTEGLVPLRLTVSWVLDRLPVTDVVSFDNCSVAIIVCLLVDNTHLFGNGLGSNGMISSDHKDLDTGALALGDCLWHALARRIDEREKPNENQIIVREIRGLRDKVKALLVNVLVELRIGKSEDSFSQTSKFFVCTSVFFSQLGRKFCYLAVDEDGLTAVKYTFGRSFQHKREGSFRVFHGVDRQLPLVSRIKLNFGNLRTSITIILDITQRLHGFHQTLLGGVTSSLQTQQVERGVVHELGDASGITVFVLDEDGVVAKSGNHL
mmetsp:Transcript_27996/g.38714  ORF Transcript_27996/g.38714 Transcript_27996/m.38714 type:complete len:265 (+) Transcript_27996:1734-2528(+)